MSATENPPSPAVEDAMPPFSRLRRRRVLTLAVVLAVILGAAWWVARQWNEITLNDARIGANVVVVSSEVSGRVSDVPIVMGDAVAKGSPLVAIDAERGRFELQELDAQLARLDATQEQLRVQRDMVRLASDSRARSADTQIAGAEADKGAISAELESARGEYRRVASLRDRGFVSEQRVDDARTRLLAAENRERRSSVGIDTARANAAAVRADSMQAAVLDRQMAALAAERLGLTSKRSQLQVDLSKRQIRAAFDGIVDQVFVDSGEYVAPGTRLLMYHDPNAVWVDANVKETDWRRIRQGAPAVVTVDAYPGREFPGIVERVGAAATSQFALLPAPNPSGNFTKITQRIPIRVGLKQDHGLLRPGMMVEVRIHGDD